MFCVEGKYLGCWKTKGVVGDDENFVVHFVVEGSIVPVNWLYKCAHTPLHHDDKRLVGPERLFEHQLLVVSVDAHKAPYVFLTVIKLHQSVLVIGYATTKDVDTVVVGAPAGLGELPRELHVGNLLPTFGFQIKPLN